MYVATRMPRPDLERLVRGEDREVDDRRARDDGHDRERVPPAHDQRQALEQQQGHDDRARQAAARSAADVGQERERRQEQGDRRVDDERAGGEGGARPGEGFHGRRER